jgi:hypothetical protein
MRKAVGAMEAVRVISLVSFVNAKSRHDRRCAPVGQLGHKFGGGMLGGTVMRGLSLTWVVTEMSDIS